MLASTNWVRLDARMYRGVGEARFARAHILLSTEYAESTRHPPCVLYDGHGGGADLDYDRVNPTSQDKSMEQLLQALQLDTNHEDLSG